MASGKYVDAFKGILQKAFQSQGDDALRATTRLVKNADDDIFDFIKHSNIDLEDVIKKDSSFLGKSSNMMHYVGEGIEEGGTTLFSDKNSFKNFLSSNYSDDLSKNFDSFVDQKNAVKNIIKEGNSSPFYSSLNKGIPDNPIGKAISEISNSKSANAIDGTVGPTVESAKLFNNIKGSSIPNVSAPSSNDVKGSSILNISPAGNHKDLKSSRYESMADYQRFKESERLEEGMTAYNKKQYDNPILKEATDYFNKKETTNILPHELTKEQLNAYRSEKINNSKSNEASFKDVLGYNKIPQKVTGVMSTAWLVNNLASKKGRQTNSELYNQQQNQGYY